MTTSAVVQTFLFIHIGVILVVTSYYLLSAAIAPGMVERGREIFARRPGRPIWIGLIISVPWVFIALAMMSGPPAFKFLGVVLFGVWFLLGLVGGAGIAQHIGSRGANGASESAQMMRGGLIISLTWVMPIVGWLGMLPLTLAAGIGCFFMSRRAGKLQAAPKAAPEAAPVAT